MRLKMPNRRVSAAYNRPFRRASPDLQLAKDACRIAHDERMEVGVKGLWVGVSGVAERLFSLVCVLRGER